MEYDKYVEAVTGAATMLGKVVERVEENTTSIPRQKLATYVNNVEKYAKLDGERYRLLLLREVDQHIACLVEYVFLLYDKEKGASVMHMNIEVSPQGEPVRFSLAYDKGTAPDRAALALYRLAGEMLENIDIYVQNAKEVVKDDLH